MQKLNLPHYEHRIRKKAEGYEIYDPIRCKYVALTPEEWVRQNFVRYLIHEKNMPKSLISVEVSLQLNTMQRRSDIVVYNRNGKPVMAVECKSDSVKLCQKTFDQLTRYNLILQVPYLVVTNGLQHYCCEIDIENRKYQFIKDIPDYQYIINKL